MAAENRDFGRFVTNWYNVHCKHTLFFEFLGLLNEFFLRSLVLGVRVGFGGREGAPASALISLCFGDPSNFTCHTITDFIITFQFFLIYSFGILASTYDTRMVSVSFLKLSVI